MKGFEGSTVKWAISYEKVDSWTSHKNILFEEYTMSKICILGILRA